MTQVSSTGPLVQTQQPQPEVAASLSKTTAGVVALLSVATGALALASAKKIGLFNSSKLAAKTVTGQKDNAQETTAFQRMKKKVCDTGRAIIQAARTHSRITAAVTLGAASLAAYGAVRSFKQPAQGLAPIAGASPIRSADDDIEALSFYENSQYPDILEMERLVKEALQNPPKNVEAIDNADAPQNPQPKKGWGLNPKVAGAIAIVVLTWLRRRYSGGGNYPVVKYTPRPKSRGRERSQSGSDRTGSGSPSRSVSPPPGDHPVSRGGPYPIAKGTKEPPPRSSDVPSDNVKTSLTDRVTTSVISWLFGI